MGMITWLVSKWDWFVYRQSRKSLARMVRGGRSGFVYLRWCEIQDIIDDNGGMPDSLRTATETFYASQRETARL